MTEMPGWLSPKYVGGAHHLSQIVLIVVRSVVVEKRINVSVLTARIGLTLTDDF